LRKLLARLALFSDISYQRAATHEPSIRGAPALLKVGAAEIGCFSVSFTRSRR